MRIVFMGTPEFAVRSLRALLEAGERIVCAVTRPDRPRGRGHGIAAPPVKEYAAERGIPVFQPRTLRDAEAAARLAALAPDLIVVAAYGLILPQATLDLPPYGCVNVHASLLPAYRGASPIRRAILDGLDETGVTTMRMEAGLDTGDILLARRAPIGPDDDYGTLCARLADVGAEVLLETVARLRDGGIVPQKQDESRATTAAKIGPEDARMDFSLPARALRNLVRALSPEPLAYTEDPDGRRLKVRDARVVREDGIAAPPGTVLEADPASEGPEIACGAGTLRLVAVVPEGRRRMSGGEYLRGRRLRAGDAFGR